MPNSTFVFAMISQRDEPEMHAKFVESKFNEFVKLPLTTTRVRDFCMKYNIRINADNQV